MTTVDLLVQMLAETREEAKQARRDRANANESLMRAQRQCKEDERDLQNAEKCLEEWRSYAGALPPDARGEARQTRRNAGETGAVHAGNPVLRRRQ